MLLEVVIIVAVSLYILNKLGFNTSVADTDVNGVRQRIADALQPEPEPRRRS